MKRSTLVASAAVALALTGSVIAFAASGPEHVLTRVEAQAKAGQLFDRLDVNHDGKLDKADHAARLNAFFDKIDTNHDGVISRDEFLAAHEHGHERGAMGSEHDRMGPDGPPMSAPPMTAMPGMPGMGADHEKWGHKEGRHGKWGPEGGMLVFAILHQADPQHTGTITREAFVDAALALFDKADTNHDGKLTGQERRAAWAGAREHMGHEHGRDPDHGPDHDRDAPGVMPPHPGA